MRASTAPVLDAALDDGWALEELDRAPPKLTSVPAPETAPDTAQRRSMTAVDDGWGLEEQVAFAPPPNVASNKPTRAKTQQERVDETVEAMEQALRLTNAEAAFFAAGDELASAPVVPVDDFSDLEPEGAKPARRRPARPSQWPARKQQVADWWHGTVRPLLVRARDGAVALARSAATAVKGLWSRAVNTFARR